jgi:hypothetical protein
MSVGSLLALVGVLGLVSAAAAPPVLYDPWERNCIVLAKCLPSGFRLSTRLSSLGGKETVETELRNRGAYVRDGRIYNRGGRPLTVYLRTHIFGYVRNERISQEHDQRQAQEIRELEKEYDVIIVEFHMI